MTAVPIPPSPPPRQVGPAVTSRVLFKPVEGAVTGGCHAEIYLPKKETVAERKKSPVGELKHFLPSLFATLSEHCLEPRCTPWFRTNTSTLSFRMKLYSSMEEPCEAQPLSLDDSLTPVSSSRRLRPFVLPFSASLEAAAMSVRDRSTTCLIVGLYAFRLSTDWRLSELPLLLVAALLRRSPLISISRSVSQRRPLRTVGGLPLCLQMGPRRRVSRGVDGRRDIQGRDRLDEDCSRGILLSLPPLVVPMSFVDR